MTQPLLRWVVACVLVAAACDDAAAPRDSAASIVVTPSADSLLTGTTLQVAVEVETAGGDPIPAGDVTWATSDPSIATVSAGGLVTTLGPGHVTIYAAIDAIADSAVLLVISPFSALQVTAGAGFTCAVAAGGGYCWGSNFAGALGNGLVEGAFRRPSLITGGMSWTALVAGEQHACGIATGGIAYCWGYNASGQLGDNSYINQVIPVVVQTAGPLVVIAPGWFHTCGLTAGGAACWGNQNGFSSIALEWLVSGWDHQCGLTATGQAYCWGANFNGQLGDGTTTVQTTPAAVAGSITFDAIDAGARFTCGMDTAGLAYCWGENVNGQLGDGTTVNRLVPTLVTGGHQFVAISGGHGHACALTTEGAAWCWGSNFNSQLGDGTQTDRLVPTLVAGGRVFSSIAVGGAHTCAIEVSGRVYCWGWNGNGQLGDNSFTDRSIPAEVWAP